MGANATRPIRSFGRASMNLAISSFAVPMRSLTFPLASAAESSASVRYPGGTSMARILPERSMAMMMSIPFARRRICSVPSRGAASASTIITPPRAYSRNGIILRRRERPADIRNGRSEGTASVGDGLNQARNSTSASTSRSRNI
ncbi:hypothetical protein SDC9_176731 [bioreactor metagenome]|uniref:Uncharacterized protein n=1 Tax=bioreactor metagenome TaxID=1076179 RepID=A0A645GU33_9ZZZZ